MAEAGRTGAWGEDALVFQNRCGESVEDVRVGGGSWGYGINNLVLGLGIGLGLDL